MNKIVMILSLLYVCNVNANNWVEKQWGLSTVNWELYSPRNEVIVAVIDTGIDVNHVGLKDSLWVNDKEIPNNGVDDDKNGFIDDIHGWDFVSNNNTVDDNHGHGTHVAGIIGAKQNNGVGIFGIAPNVKIMVLKYFDPRKPGNNLANTIKAINYAIDNGADIINYSGGGLEYSRPEYNAIKRARDKGIIYVAAAGNERCNSDFNKYYPADYELDNIISVTAVNPQKRVLSSANYGVLTVDIAAPGENIYSTLPGNYYGHMTGTSQATPYVTGTIALIKGMYGDVGNTEIRQAILMSGNKLDQLSGKTINGRLLDVNKAIEYIRMIRLIKTYDKTKSIS